MMKRSRVRVLAVALGAATVAIVAGVSPAKAAPSVLLVCKGFNSPGSSCPAGAQYDEIQDAVQAAGNGDWVLVAPGTYTKPVTVDSSHGLTDGLHIRGMDRNGVVLDGSGGKDHGIFVNGVDNVWLENMTGRHFTSGSGNAFWFTGVDGWWANYLTAYDNANYGIYAYDSTSSGDTPAAMTHDYASWNADSGFYIGGCSDCNAVIANSKSEHNALGYSGTNAGGETILMNSEWNDNRAGIVPNTLTSEPDPPQSGLVIVNNWVHDNNATDTPGTGLAALAPLGTGIDLAGGWNNIVRNNLIENHKHHGVLQHWLFTPPVGNQILYNRFRNVGYSGMPGDADIGLDTTSVQTCLEGNVDITGPVATPATTDPPEIGGLQHCGKDNPTRKNLGRGIYQPGDPVVSAMTALNAAGITEPGDFQGVGPAPGAMDNMPNPCEGAPANSWCS